MDPGAGEPAPPHTEQPTSDPGTPPSDAAAPAAPAPDAAPAADHREPVKQVFEGGAKQTIYTARSLGASKLSAHSMSSDGGGGGGDAPPRPRRSDRIALNLSGTVFVTTRDTLMRDERTYFAAMLRMQPPPPRHEPPPPVPPPAAEFFVDRDPTHFRHILNYLRGNRMNLECRGAESLAFLDELLLEAQYFNINGLCEELARRIAEITRRQKEEASEDKDFRLIKCELCDVQDVFHEWVIEKNYEFESMQVCDDLCLVVLARRVSRGELALVERLMKT